MGKKSKWCLFIEQQEMKLAVLRANFTRETGKASAEINAKVDLIDDMKNFDGKVVEK